MIQLQIKQKKSDRACFLNCLSDAKSCKRLLYSIYYKTKIILTELHIKIKVANVCLFFSAMPFQ